MPISQDPVVYLMSEDGVIFQIPKNAACKSSFIKDLVVKLGPAAEQEPIRLRSVCSSMLEKVVLFLRHLAEEPIFGEWDDEQIKRWETAFLGTHYPTISHLNLVARLLKINHLQEITLKACDKITMGKSKNGLRRFFDEQDRITYEDEERLYTDYN